MSEKTKNELLDELIDLGFIVESEKGDYDNLSNATLSGLIEKVTSLGTASGGDKLEDDERSAYELTISNLKSEIEKLKESSPSGPQQDPIYLKRRETQKFKAFASEMESIAKKIALMAKEARKKD